MIGYIVSLPPEIIQNKDYTPKSDIYSFGIIILQVLTNQINVFSDIENKGQCLLRINVQCLFKINYKIINKTNLSLETF